MALARRANGAGPGFRWPAPWRARTAGVCRERRAFAAAVKRVRLFAMQSVIGSGSAVLGLLLCLGGMGAGCDEPKEGVAVAPAATSPQAVSAIPAPAASPERAAVRPAPAKQKLEDCPQGNTVELADPEVEKAVRLKAQKPTGAITKTDLARLRSLNLSQVKLERLDLCLFHPMVALRELFLGPGEIRDLSPIAGAVHLESLRASLNPIESIGSLAAMKKMDRLDLAHTQVSDLTPLSELTSLTELLLDSTPVSDIGPLASLEKLEVLVLKNTRVKDLSPLKGLRALKSVDVRGAPVEDTLVVTRPGLHLQED